MGASSELKVRLLEALRKAAYPSYLEPPRLAGLLAALEASLTPVIAGFSVDGESALGSSRFGGQPDFPADVEWPCSARDGDPLAFVCQIELAELAGMDPEGRLPARGLWSLFSSCDSDAAYGGEIDDETTAIVYLPDPPALAPRAFPATLPAAGRLEAKPLRFAPSLICQTFDAPRNRYDDARFDGAIEKAMREALIALGSHTPEVRVLANAPFFQRDIAELYDPAREIELIGFPGVIASRQWGEGEFHVVIERDALAKHELGAARVLFEPGT